MLPGSDAEEHARKRFPHKTVKRVRSSIRATSVRSFLGRLPLAFQRGGAGDLAATYHWTFTGKEDVKATIRIENQRLAVEQGHIGNADVRITADSDTWIRIVNREYPVINAIILRRVRVKGSMDLFRAFGRCFPG